MVSIDFKSNDYDIGREAKNFLHFSQITMILSRYRKEKTTCKSLIFKWFCDPAGVTIHPLNH
jgi:hypothetical protein